MLHDMQSSTHCPSPTGRMYEAHCAGRLPREMALTASSADTEFTVPGAFHLSSEYLVLCLQFTDILDHSY